MDKNKNIIFDLGNVILDINPAKSRDAFAALGLKNFDRLYSLINQSDLFDKLEIGVISKNEFFNEIRRISDTNLSDIDITKAWNALILDYTYQRIEILKSVRKKYRSFILSNTNEIHYEYYTDLLKNKYKFNGLEDLVEKAYFSHNIGMKKPDFEIYKYVLKDANIKAEESLFIDDNKDNIDAASKIGLNTIWINEKTKLEDIDFEI